MSDADDEAAGVPVIASPGCMVCGKLGPFGFTTKRGSVWTCLEHRDAGERVLVPPPSGQWNSGRRDRESGGVVP